jgi:hypothetical protein
MEFEKYFNKIRNLKNLMNFKKKNKIKGNILIAFPNENIETEKRKNFINLILLFFNMDASEIFEDENKVFLSEVEYFEKDCKIFSEVAERISWTRAFEKEFSETKILISYLEKEGKEYKTWWIDFQIR